MKPLIQEDSIHQMDTSKLEKMAFGLSSDTNPRTEEESSLSAEIERLAKKCKRMEERMKAQATAEVIGACPYEGKKFYSTLEAAKRIGVDRSALYYMRKRGKIPSIRVGRTVMYEALIIDAMIANGSLKKYGR